MNEELIKELKELAARGTWYDDSEENGNEYLMIDDYAGGNFDDAFYGGERAGETDLARKILTSLDISWTDDSGK